MILEAWMAKRSSLTRQMPRLELRAAFEPSTIDAEKRTVELVWTTGARVMRGFWDPYWEELSLDPKHVRMDRLRNGAPLLDSHNADSISSVIGVVESADLQKTRGVATVRFDRGPAGEDVFRKVADGIVRNVSVGYQVHRLEKVEDSKGKIPVYRATDWEPAELSMVPVGADAGAGTRASSTTNPCEFIQERAMEGNEETPVTRSADELEESVAKSVTEAARKERVAQARLRGEAEQQAAEEAVAKERDRIDSITEISERSGLGAAWARNLIKAGVSKDKAREAAFAFMTKKESDEFTTDGQLRIEPGTDARDKFVTGATAWIIERSGHSNTITEAKKVARLAHNFKGVETDPGEFRGMRMPDLARFALELRGRPTKGLHGESLIRAALTVRGDQGFNTTSDFAVLLETAVNKIFVGQYALAPVTWPSWCGRKSVQDFRTSTFYRPGTFGVLDSVTEAGEIKHKNIPDGEKRTITPGTKANIIGITRRALANDDLGAFQNLASGLGLAAALTVESDAFALVTANSGLGISYDANPLFHSSRSNIGPTGAMSAATLDGARAIMAKQKDPSANQFLALRPHCWLGPVELGGIAKQFNSSTTDPTDNKAQGVTNKVMNLFTNIVDSPYLSAQSATRHYLLADPALYPVFAVGFIDGQEAPRIETEQSFGFDGVQMKVVLDYGTAALDFRGAVTCAGV